jgi:hypothetical protein
MKKLAVVAIILSGGSVFAQNTGSLIGQGDQYKTITTAVPFLTITPDSRAAAMGDAGVASSPDVNSAYWNSAKMVFNENKWGLGMSYTPWLAKIINDMHIVYLAGYYKISRVQAVGFSMKYFDMGDVQLTTIQNEPNGRYNPRDFSFDVTYSRLLSETFSLGGSIRYIQSNLIGFTVNGNDAKPGKSVAVDVGVYYTKPMVSKNSVLSLGATITNIGSKISYNDANNKNFIPGNLRLGGAYKVDVNPMNSFTFVLDFNKLLAPSPDSTTNINQKTLLDGVFGSFGDAQGGFSEEMHEIMISAGVEYWYNDLIAGRIGYFNEAKDKGNRKYLTAGVGVKYNVFAFDFAYMVPINKRENALAETLRFTLHYIPRIKTSDDEVIDQ